MKVPFEWNILAVRMGMRRFNPLTNALSKKIQNHVHAPAIYFMQCNFARIHSTRPLLARHGVRNHCTLMGAEGMVEVLEAWEERVKVGAGRGAKFSSLLLDKLRLHRPREAA